MAPLPRQLCTGLSRRSALARVVAALVSVTAAPAQALLFFQTPEWPATKQSMRERYPAVPQLSTAQLRNWLAGATRAQPLLLDTRAQAEFEVSHLLGARRASNLAAAAQTLQGRAKDSPVVVYCSVGVRSTALADQLIRDGWRNVSNLEGSLFEWANLGGPVYRGGVPVTKVHPYDKRWGVLLERKLWSDDLQ